MKAPDKMYYKVLENQYLPTTTDNVSTEGAIEYIRKDALMEKLEKAAASYKKRSDEGELVWQNMCGINEAINILNSM